jgi:hypothetical protein
MYQIFFDFASSALLESRTQYLNSDIFPPLAVSAIHFHSPVPPLLHIHLQLTLELRSPQFSLLNAHGLENLFCFGLLRRDAGFDIIFAAAVLAFT